MILAGIVAAVAVHWLGGLALWAVAVGLYLMGYLAGLYRGEGRTSR